MKRAIILLITQAECSNSLNQCWSKIESWHTEVGEDEAIEQLHDRYAAFLLRHDIWCRISGDDLRKRIKAYKKTAPGYDGWAKHDLVLLPRGAWDDLAFLLELGPSAFVSTTTSIVKRIPLHKNDQHRPDSVRPIDISHSLCA